MPDVGARITVTVGGSDTGKKGGGRKSLQKDLEGESLVGGASLLDRKKETNGAENAVAGGPSC